MGELECVVMIGAQHGIGFVDKKAFDQSKLTSAVEEKLEIMQKDLVY